MKSGRIMKKKVISSIRISQILQTLQPNFFSNIIDSVLCERVSYYKIFARVLVFWW